ncbi:MAG: DUF2269 domain-containing protein [Chloroflexota bacterium]
MIVQTRQGERRLSASTYRFLLSAHIIVSVGWLGITVAKFALGIAASRAGEPATVAALVSAMSVLDRAFPPAAIATLVTGVALSLGTKWGLIQYYWIVVKLVLTILVPVSAIQFGDRFIWPALNAATAAQQLPGLLWGVNLLLVMAVAHLLMLGAASVISVYKPWGKTPFGRRAAERSVTKIAGAPARQAG